MKHSNSSHVFVTNIPAPYREKVHEMASIRLNNAYQVLYCSATEPNRDWKFKMGKYQYSYLKNTTIAMGRGYIHFSAGLVTRLNELNPDVLITSGFSPTMLLGFLWAKYKNKKHITFTDATPDTERNISFLRKLLRRVVYKYSDAFIGASQKSKALYRNYGIKEHRIFLSALCIDNNRFIDAAAQNTIKDYDVIFAGRFVQDKGALFVIEVLNKAKNKLGDLKILFLGSGPLEVEMQQKMDDYGLDYSMPGFVHQELLPKMYSNAKIFLFPTLRDAWGIVANEACASGLPTMTTQFAGCANELIINDYNGYILPLDADIWSTKMVELLTNGKKYAEFSKRSQQVVQKFTHSGAAKGICDAVAYAQQ